MRRSSDIKVASLHSQTGFTLLELLIAVPPLLILIATIVALLVGLVTESTRAQGKANIAYEMQSSLNFITDDTSGAVKFLSTKEAAFSDAYGPDNSGGAWSYNGTSPSNRVLLLKTIATSTNSKDPAKQIVYINQVGCGVDAITNNPPLTVNTIYFVRSGILYRRVLTDTSKTLCSSEVYQRQSCPRISMNTLSGTCKSFDTELATGVTSFAIDYYDKSANLLDVYTTPALLESAETIELKITTRRMIVGERETYTGSLKISKLNR